MLDQNFIAEENAKQRKRYDAELDALMGTLSRRGVDIEALRTKLARFGVAIPSWGVGTGGTRFARFPGGGEPRNIFDKLDDCGIIQQLGRVTPTVSTHFPWDNGEVSEIKECANLRGLRFDAVNSNTFQDHFGDKFSYKYGSLSHTNGLTRAQAVAHNIDAISYGRALGSKALTVWIGDGSNFPGQSNFRAQFERYLGSLSEIYAALPDDWILLIEHKIYEPAFYSTVVQDWGTSLIAAQSTGSRAKCLVDLGHHAPSVNIEMIVSRLASAGKLGGFHFNDSKYGDDDLDAGVIDPYRLFLVFNELVDLEIKAPLSLAHMLDQSHNVTDPIESLIMSAGEVMRAYALALLVDREALADAQEKNDAIMATKILKTAFRTDIEPLMADIRQMAGGAIDPIAVYRASNYREKVTRERPTSRGGSGGIV